MLNNWLTVDQVARLLNMTRQGVTWRIHNGWKQNNLAEKDTQFKQWVISPKAIEAYKALPVRKDGRRYVKNS